jgi:hypothetical protein
VQSAVKIGTRSVYATAVGVVADVGVVVVGVVVAGVAGDWAAVVCVDASDGPSGTPFEHPPSAEISTAAAARASVFRRGHII